MHRRLLLACSDTLVVSAKLVDFEGGAYFFVRIASPCRFLEKIDAGYLCQVWDHPDKPELCRHYPANQFFDLDAKKFFAYDRSSEVREIIGDFCPAVARLTDIVVQTIAKENGYETV